jgi:hypothetical protein
VLLDTGVVNDFKIRVCTRIDSVHHSLRPQAVRRMFALGSSIGLEFREIRVTIPIDACEQDKHSECEACCSREELRGDELVFGPVG